MLNIKSIRLVMAVIAVFVSFALGASAAFAENARDFRKKVIDRYEGDDSQSMTTMKLQKIVRDKKGNVKVRAERIRKVKRYSKAYGKDDKIVMFFLEPADVRDTAFLSYVYEARDKDNDQWLYMPTLKKIKRIASSDKSGSFMGTDFSYVDISDIKLDDYTHRFMADQELAALLKDKSVARIFKKKFGKTKAGFKKSKKWLLSDGLKVVESKPVDKKVLHDDGYSKRIDWIDPDSLIIKKSMYFGKNGRAFKLRQTKKIKKIQDIWSYLEMEMENFQRSHRTIITISDTKYNTGVKDSYFTQRTIEQGL